MNIFKSLCLAALVAAPVAIAAPAAAMDDKVALRTELQIAMQRHVERGLIDGAVIDVNLETGDLVTYFPTAAHPMVMVGEGYFVLCADLTTAEGDVVDVDYYMTETPRGYRVFRTEIRNRGILKDLMAAGEVREF